MSKRTQRNKELEELDVPIRSYTRRDNPYSAHVDYNKYHNWYYNNTDAKLKQSKYYANRRAEAKKLEAVEKVC